MGIYVIVSCVFQMVRTIVKLRIFVSIIAVGIGLCSLILNRSSLIIQKDESDSEDKRDSKESSDSNYPSDYKYILSWTPDTENVKLMGWSYPALDGFQKAGCAEYRCHLTNNRSYLGISIFY